MKLRPGVIAYRISLNLERFKFHCVYDYDSIRYSSSHFWRQLLASADVIRSLVLTIEIIDIECGLLSHVSQKIVAANFFCQIGST